MKSAAYSLFIAAQEAVNLRNVLKDLGYPQAPTDILCDDACAVGLATNTGVVILLITTVDTCRKAVLNWCETKGLFHECCN